MGLDIVPNVHPPKFLPLSFKSPNLSLSTLSKGNKEEDKAHQGLLGLDGVSVTSSWGDCGESMSSQLPGTLEEGVRDKYEQVQNWALASPNQTWPMGHCLPSRMTAVWGLLTIGECWSPWAWRRQGERSWQLQDWAQTLLSPERSRH